MPRFNVTAPDGSTIPVDAPPGATEQDAIAFAASVYKPAAPTDGVPGPRKERGFLSAIGAPIEAVSQGVISGGGNVMFGGQRLLGMGLEAVGAKDTGTFLQQDAAKRLAQSQATVAPFKQEFPIATGTGELGAEVLATYPVGAAIAAPLKLIPATAPLAQAIRTSGVSTGQALRRG